MRDYRKNKHTLLKITLLLFFLVNGHLSAQPKALDTKPAAAIPSAADTKINPPNLNQQLTENDNLIYRALTEAPSAELMPTLKDFKNTDASKLVNFYASIKNCSITEESKVKTKLINTSAIAKLAEIDSTYKHNFIVVNKSYSFLQFPSEITEDEYQYKLSYIEKLAPPIKLRVTDVVNSLLPPVVIIDDKCSLVQYKKTVNDFFANYPDMLNYCDESFLYLLQESKFNIMLKFHLQSRNNTRPISNK